MTDTTTNTAVGSCGVPTGQVFSCGLSGGRSIPSGDSVSVELDGITNPTTAATNKTLTVSTTSDLPNVTSAAYTVDPGQQITQPTVTVKPPSSAAGADGLHDRVYDVFDRWSISRGQQRYITIPSDPRPGTALGLGAWASDDHQHS